jgi:DNA-binding CsgD family transcriptional regulator
MYIKWFSSHETSFEIDRLCTIKPGSVAKHPDDINRKGGGNGWILCNMEERRKNFL